LTFLARLDLVLAMVLDLLHQNFLAQLFRQSLQVRHVNIESQNVNFLPANIDDS
jgi:hypothetical protein